MAAHTIVECLDCGYSTPFFATSVFCPRCGSFWREALYDYQSIALSLPLQLPGRPFDIWRYRELLPVRDPNPEFSLGAGGSPLIHAYNLGALIGCQNLFIKDERQGPTRSFKSRQAAVTVASLLEAGVDELAVASTGNLAMAYASLAARTGIKMWAFLSSRIPISKVREIQLYGARTIKVCGTFEHTRETAREFARQRNIFLDQAAQTIPSVEAMKTIGYEIAEQLTAMMGPSITKENKPPSAYRSPDWYIQPVSLGLGALGVMKGFAELHLMGLTSRSPTFALFQPEGCAPMVRAWKQGLDQADPILESETMIETLASTDPGRSYSLLLERMDQEAGGLFDSVTDSETFKAQKILARTEGILCEPAAAVAVAGLLKLAQSNIVKDTDTIVVTCTGHTHQNEIGLQMNQLEMDGDESAGKPLVQGDGIITALLDVTPLRYPKVLISQPDPSFTKFVHRFLDLQGNFEIIEAPFSEDMAEIAQNEKPDLIILDLGAPNMTGFTILDKLGNLPEIQDMVVYLTLTGKLVETEITQLDCYLENRMRTDSVVTKLTIDEIHQII
jgi:threonine synthase